jgi:hypothetical protein
MLPLKHKTVFDGGVKLGNIPQLYLEQFSQVVLVPVYFCTCLFLHNPAIIEAPDFAGRWAPF